MLFSLDDVVVEIRDINLNMVNAIHPKDLDVQILDHYNGVGSWVVRLPREHERAEELKAEGAGIVLSLRGNRYFSGPCIGWSYEATKDDPRGTISFTGLSDSVVLQDRIIYPDPTNPDMESQALSHDVRKGNVETLMHEYVSHHAGPKAASARKVKNLILGVDGGRGPYLTRRERFTRLDVLLQELGDAYNIGWYIKQRGKNLSFETWSVKDYSSAIRLEVENNRLSSEEVNFNAPSATRVLVAGQGELVDRMLLEVSNTESIASETRWGRRIERFLDQRQSSEKKDLIDAGNEVLMAEGSPFLTVRGVPSDENDMRFGEHWNLGDKVTVVLDGVEYKDVVTGVAFFVNSEGVVPAIRLGRGEGDNDAISRLEGRVSNLERNSESQASAFTVIPAGGVSGGKWVRVAYCPGSRKGTAMVSGTFTLTSSRSGRHDIVNWSASSIYLDSNIELANYTAYNHNPQFSAIRFVRDPNDDVYGEGWLEVFVVDTGSQIGDIRVEITGTPGPMSKNWQPVEAKESTVADSWVEHQVGIYPMRMQDFNIHPRRKAAVAGTEPYVNPSIKMQPGSVVSLAGLIELKDRSVTESTLGYIPQGMRPRLRIPFVAPNMYSGQAPLRIDVTPEGVVALRGGNVTYDSMVNISGISYVAYQ